VLAILILFTTVSVILRKFADIGFAGWSELARLGLSLVVFLGLAYCWNQGAHAQIDLLLKRMRPRLAFSIQAFSALCGMVFFGFAIPGILEMAIHGLNAGEVTATVRVSVFPFRVLAMFGCALFIVVMLLTSIKHVKNFIRGET